MSTQVQPVLKPKRRKNKNKPNVVLVEEVKAVAAPTNRGPGSNPGPGAKLRRRLALGGASSRVGAGLAAAIGRNSLFTNTLPGMVWLAKVLDPAHPTLPGAVIDVPDRVSANVVCTQMTHVNHLSALPDDSNNKKFIGSTYSTAKTPFTQAQLLEFWKKSVKNKVDWNLVMWVDPSIGCIFTMKYFSLPTVHVVTLAADELVYESNVSDNTKEPSDLALFENFYYDGLQDLLDREKYISRLRMTFHGTTVEFTGASVYDQGELSGAQHSMNWRDDDYYESGGASPHGTVTLKMPVHKGEGKFFLSYLRLIPQSSPKSYSGRARDGYYCPSALDGPTILFRDLDLNPVDSSLNTNGKAELYIHPFVAMQVKEEFVWTRGLLLNLATLVEFQCTERFSFQGQISHWTGMDVRTTLKATTRYGMACQPDGTSILNYFAYPSSRHDDVALNAAIDVRQEMADFYPASFNSLDTLWATIKRLAAPFLRGVRPLVGEALKAGVGAIPGFGALLRPAVGELVERIGLT